MLKDFIDGKPLPLEQVLDFGAQIADEAHGIARAMGDTAPCRPGGKNGHTPGEHALFVPERGHRVNPACSPCRKPASQRRDT